MSANEKLISNLEKQLERLVEQLKDLEECRSELPEEEYDLLKSETVEQIKEFEESLDRLQKGDVTLNSKFYQMKMSIRRAISSAFNTKDMIQMFGDQAVSDSQKQLQKLEEDFRLKKIDVSAFDKQKLDVLMQIQEQGGPISNDHMNFIMNQQGEEFVKRLERINET